MSPQIKVFTATSVFAAHDTLLRPMRTLLSAASPICSYICTTVLSYFELEAVGILMLGTLNLVLTVPVSSSCVYPPPTPTE